MSAAIKPPPVTPLSMPPVRQRVLEALNRAVQDLQDRDDREAATALAQLLLDWRRRW